MKPEALWENKFGSAVTNALSCSSSPAAVRPSPLTTAPVPFRKKRVRHELHFECRMIGGLPPAFPRRSFRCGSIPAVSPLLFTFPFAEPQAEAFWGSQEN
jgi:hypothetical protein